MAVIYEIRPGHAVRRPKPKRWSPKMMKAMFPEFDGEPAEPYQLSLIPKADIPRSVQAVSALQRSR